MSHDAKATLRRILEAEIPNIFAVELLAFGSRDKGIGDIREVEVPVDELASAKSDEAVLDLIFRYGQNDFQPRPGQPSVSVNDVINLHGKKYRVSAVGFKELSRSEYNKYVADMKSGDDLSRAMKMFETAATEARPQSRSAVQTVANWDPSEDVYYMRDPDPQKFHMGVGSFLYSTDGDTWITDHGDLADSDEFHMLTIKLVGGPRDGEVVR